jgi:3-dehydroquinate synthase
MKGLHIAIRHRTAPSNYSIDVAASMLDQIGAWLANCLGGEPKKVAIISNSTVFSLYGKTVTKSLRSAGIKTSVWLMKDGERHKNLASLKDALEHLTAERLTRADVVIAFGGGVVGDLAGFAAAVYLRGIRFLQVPTTLLAMIDSSVGGKTGINTEFGKNLVGAFHRPSGVLIDVETLRTLPGREMTAGFCEAIKQGAISGRKLFDETANYLTRTTRITDIDTDRLARLIAHQVEFKASIVGQDETESTTRNDARSRKILNFGHTFGHALEKVTDYRRLRHGEAVGYGIRLACRLSKNLDLLSQSELELLNDVVHRAGRLPGINDISPVSIFEAFKFDKKSSTSGLNWVLLNGIGKPLIVPEQDIPRAALREAVKSILQS